MEATSISVKQLNQIKAIIRLTALVQSHRRAPIKRSFISALRAVQDADGVP